MHLPYEIVQIIYNFADIDTKIAIHEVYGNNVFKPGKLHHIDTGPLDTMNKHKLFFINLQIALDTFFARDL